MYFVEMYGYIKSYCQLHLVKGFSKDVKIILQIVKSLLNGIKDTEIFDIQGIKDTEIVDIHGDVHKKMQVEKLNLR